MRIITDMFASVDEQRAGVEHDFDFRLSHARGRMHRGPGSRIHAGERYHLREAALGPDLDVDEFAPRLSFFFHATTTSSKRSQSSVLPGVCGRAS